MAADSKSNIRDTSLVHLTGIVHGLLNVAVKLGIVLDSISFTILGKIKNNYKCPFKFGSGYIFVWFYKTKLYLKKGNVNIVASLSILHSFFIHASLKPK